METTESQALTSPNPPSAPDAELSRRRILGGVVVAGAAVPVLAACGGGESGGSGGGDTTSEDDAPKSDDKAPEDTPADDQPEEEDPGSGGTALAKTSQIPVDGGMVFKDKKVVVTQPEEGTFKAFTAVCTHKGCTVASVEAGKIACPCHGSMFSAADGSVQGGPATAPLKEMKVTVDGDAITVA